MRAKRVDVARSAEKTMAERETKAPAAYRIQSERLVLRCWEERDASLLKEAVDSSLDHLRPWMLWAAQEPEPVEAKQTRIRAYRSTFEEGGDYVYGVFDRAEERVLGAGGLHDRLGEGEREIGYWIRVDSLRRGYATEMAAVLTRVGFELVGLERMEIHCDPRNLPSRGVPRRLGYRHLDTLPEVQLGPDGKARDAMVWRLDADEYPGSPATAFQMAAFLASGRRAL
ncbi:MAG: GNAT family N-acetyltransferase [Myxococcota bacterium]